MSIYLGNLGRLVELKGPSSQSVAADDGYTFETTLEGRVKAQARTARPRQWSVDIGAATPADLANLLAFAGGEWGNGPFVWVSVEAPVTNLLNPDASLCGPEIEAATAAYYGGPMALGGGGVAGRSLMITYPASKTTLGRALAPVIPGRKVTGSIWVLGAGAKLQLNFLAADGSTILAAGSVNSGATGAATRLQVTGTAPSGAVGCILSTTGATQISRPAITWTDSLFDWQPGEGCPKAIIHGLSKQTLLALRDPSYGRYSNASFTITEVG